LSVTGSKANFLASNNHQLVDLDRSIEESTEGLPDFFRNQLRCISNNNAATVCNYIIALNREINLSQSYRKDNIKILFKFSKFVNNKRFLNCSKADLITFFDSLRKPESADPLHKWIGTYNLYLEYLLRFFKWLYNPDIEPDKRPKPEIVTNLSRLRRKEKSIYRPSDLWTSEDNHTFLKFCPSRRMKCYHAMAHDTACRPSELLNVRIKDVVFKYAGGTQYAEVLVNGKTGTRYLPLIDSIPYIKDYLQNEHPQAENPGALLFSAECGKNFGKGKPLDLSTLSHIYKKYERELFPKLINEDPNISRQDKEKLSALLKKPFILYVFRHSSISRHARILKESTLRAFSGWTAGSDMVQRYVHLYNNAPVEDLLVARGIISKDETTNSRLGSKQCPNCSESNKPDSRFCTKCRLVLSFDAYNETLEEQKKKEDKLAAIEDKFNIMQSQIQALITTLADLKDQGQIDQTAQILYKSGIIEDMKTK
jgi:integrase